METEVYNLIKLIHENSENSDAAFKELMKTYGLKSLREVTPEQLREFVAEHCAINMAHPDLGMER